MLLVGRALGRVGGRAVRRSRKVSDGSQRGGVEIPLWERLEGRRRGVWRSQWRGRRSAVLCGWDPVYEMAFDRLAWNRTRVS